VRRGEEVVGSVEYAVLFPREEPSPLVGDFLSFVKSRGRAILKEEDPYGFHPIDAELPTFEPSAYHRRAPWDGEFPAMWKGQAWGGRKVYFTTILGELKKMWMEGHNQVQGVPLTEPIVEFAEEHDMVLTGLPTQITQRHEDWGTADQPEPAPFEDRVRLARESPVTRGMYFLNEDHLERFCRRLYTTDHAIDIDEAVSEDDRIRDINAKAGFRNWLERKHGDLATLNERWDSSVSSWSEIGFPELPLEWVEEVVEDTGYGQNKRAADWHRTWMYVLFQTPLRYHAWARYPRLLDFTRYLQAVWGRKYKAMEGHEEIWSTDFENRAKDLPLEPREGESVPGFIYATKARPNPYVFNEVPEFNGISYDHPACKVPPHFSQVPVDIFQTARGKPCWNSEHHLYNHGRSTPSRVRYHLLQTFLMGQFKSTSFHRVSNTRAGHLERHAVATRVGEYINEHEAAFRALYEPRRSPAIDVLYTEGNRGWNTLPQGPARPDFGGAIAAYGHVGALGKPWKYVMNEDVSADTVRGTLVVAAPWLLPETLERINALPDDRRVVVVGSVPSEDEYGGDLPSEALETFEARSRTISSWEGLPEVIEPAADLDPVHRTVRQANFYWWTGGHGRGSFGMPVPELEVRRGSRDGRQYVALTNHSEEPVQGTIPGAGGDQIRELTATASSRREYEAGESLTFEPETVTIYEVS
jgi:hypothetical protein